MKKIVYSILTLLILGACTLSASQEKKLNESITAYLHSRNECLVVGYVAFTYPDLVAYYKSQGDSIFISKFDCNKDSLYLQNPTIRKTSKSDNAIQIQYDLDIYNKFSGEKLSEKHKLYALSMDKGNSWFFMDEKIYVDKSILPKFKRMLLDK